MLFLVNSRADGLGGVGYRFLVARRRMSEVTPSRLHRISRFCGWREWQEFNLRKLAIDTASGSRSNTELHPHINNSVGNGWS